MKREYVVVHYHGRQGVRIECTEKIIRAESAAAAARSFAGPSRRAWRMRELDADFAILENPDVDQREFADHIIAE